MTDQEFLVSMAPLVSYCTDELDDHQRLLYRGGLDDLRPGDLAAAVTLYLLEAKTRWWPSIGQLRALAEEHRAGRQLAWDEAWGLICDAACIWSRHDKNLAFKARAMVPEDLHPLLKTLGGFPAIAECDAATLSVKQSHFRKAYEDRQTETKRRRALPAAERLKSILGQAADGLAIPKHIEGDIPHDFADNPEEPRD